MRRYYYTIEEMTQITSEFNRKEKLIAEYIETEDIETMTEEDMTNLFGDTYFNYNTYSNASYLGNRRLYIYISDYELHLLNNGYDPFTSEIIVKVKDPDYHIIPFIDTVQPDDFEAEDWWVGNSCAFESMLCQIHEEEVLLYSGVYLFPEMAKPPLYPAVWG